MVKIDLERHWQRGHQISLEAYLSKYPELGNPADVTADLIHAEYEIRRQFGAPADLPDYARRFPRQVEELRRRIARGDSALSGRSWVSIPTAAPGPSGSSPSGWRPGDAAQPLPQPFG